MALRNGVDTVGFVSLGTYTETYVSSSGQANINSLYASWGMLEEAPNTSIVESIYHILNQ